MEIIEGLVKLFSGKKAPTDKQVHKFAENHDLDPDTFEQEHVYTLLNALLRGVGKHNHVPDSEFDAKELEMGIQIELEHTDSLYVSKMIAKDHLAECSDYYTRLKQMEKECEGASLEELHRKVQARLERAA